MSQVRDDSRERAELLIATLKLVADSIPVGYGSEQQTVIREVENNVNDAIAALKQYVSLRLKM